LVHRAHRLLSESTLILCTLRELADGRTNARLAPTVVAVRVNNPDRDAMRSGVML